MMDGPVLWCFAAVFGAVRHKIAQKVVGRSVIALWGRCVFLRGMPGVGISPLSPLARHSRLDRESPNSKVKPILHIFYKNSIIYGKI